MTDADPAPDPAPEPPDAPPADAVPAVPTPVTGETAPDVEALLDTVRAPGRISTAQAVRHVVVFTLRRVLLGRRVLWSLLLVLLPAAVSLLVSRAAEAHPRMQEEYFYLAFSALHFPVVIPVFALIFATSFPWPQADEGALTYWFTSPAPRWAVVVGRFVAAVLAGWILLPISALAIALPLTPPEGHSIMGMALRAVAVTAVVYPAYLALFSVISTFTRRALPLAVAFLLVENVLAALEGIVPLMTIVYYARTLLWHGVPLELRHWAEEALVMFNTLDAGEALPVADCLVVVLAITLFCIAAAAVLTQLLEFRGKNVEAT